jgi:hypothetical protein
MLPAGGQGEINTCELPMETQQAASFFFIYHMALEPAIFGARVEQTYKIKKGQRARCNYVLGEAAHL